MQAKMLRLWREEENGIIIVSLPPKTGNIGQAWSRFLWHNDFLVDDSATSLLFSSDFRLTDGRRHEVVILNGLSFPSRNGGGPKENEVEERAYEMGLIHPRPEIACLLRTILSDDDLKAMRLWEIVVMHKPVVDTRDKAMGLSVSRNDRGRKLCGVSRSPDQTFPRDFGYAYLSPV